MPSELLDSLPPHDLDAELSVVGSMLLDPTTIDDVASILSGNEFYSEPTGVVFNCLRLMNNGNEAIDVNLLVAWMKEAGEYDRVGTSHLSKIIRAAPVAAHAEHYARIVSEKAKRRALIHIGTDMVKSGYSDKTDADGMIAKAETALAKACETNQGDAVDASVAINEAIDNVRAIQAGTKQGGLMVGLPSFDHEAGGLFASELVVIAARPSTGKTSLAMQVAVHVALRHPEPTLFASLEMDRVLLASRILAARAGVDSNRLRTGNLSDTDVHAMEQAGQDIQDIPIVIDDRTSQSVAEVRRTARKIQRQRGLSMVVIDYLTRMKPADARAKRYEQVGTMARDLKGLARELACPVVVLSQLNRSSAEEKPKLANLRESGEIEQEADMVLALWRPGQFKPDEEDLEGKAWLLVLKNRNGPIGEYQLQWDARATTFTEAQPVGFSEFD